MKNIVAAIAVLVFLSLASIGFCGTASIENSAAKVDSAGAGSLPF